VENTFSHSLNTRAVYLNNRSVGLIVLDPDLLGTTHKLVLNGDGSSTYRQLELTGRYTIKEGQQLIFSYTRSRAQGSLNTYDNFVGNFPTAVLHPPGESVVPGEVPNRF